MSISMEALTTPERADGFGSGHTPRLCIAVWQLQCRRCGFSPHQGTVIAPSRCPKCASAAFERIPVPGAALQLFCGATRPTRDAEAHHAHAIHDEVLGR